jgi:hypothetical protein
MPFSFYVFMKKLRAKVVFIFLKKMVFKGRFTPWLHCDSTMDDCGEPLAWGDRVVSF